MYANQPSAGLTRRLLLTGASPHSPARTRLFLVSATLAGLAIFVVDCFTSLDIAIATLHVLVILIFANILSTQGVLLVTAVCSAMTVLAWLIGHGDDWALSAALRCLISVCVICTACLLTLMNKRQRRRVEDRLLRREAQLVHATRLNTLGELAASIAHEISQPLAAVGFNGEAGLRWLDRPNPDLGKVRYALEQLMEGNRRASEVVEHIRAMSRDSRTEPQWVDLGELAAQSLQMLEQEARCRRVSVTTDVPACLPPLLGDRIQLQQLFINLLMNALQAMTHDDIHDRRLHVRFSHADDQQLNVSVEDSGPGIREQHLPRLFDGFFTTRADGLGLGLSICRTIVDSHGGRIWAGNRPQGGAALSFSLPVTKDVGR